MFAAAPTLRGPRGLRRWLRLLRGLAILAIVAGAWAWQPVAESAAPSSAPAYTAAHTSDGAGQTAVSLVEEPEAPTEPAAESGPAITPDRDATARSADRSTVGVRGPPRWRAPRPLVIPLHPPTFGGVYLMDPFQTAVHIFESDFRGAVLIWLLLISVAALPFVLMSIPAREERRARKARRAAQRAVRRRPENTPAELRRYAEEVAVAARRATVMAERRRAAWAGVLRTQEATWRAYDEAVTAAQRATQAEAFTVPDAPSTADERAARRRYLERTATLALRRGDLTAVEYGDILAHRNGWNPYAHPFQQDAKFCVLRRERLRRACATLSSVERSAWQAAEVAMAAQRSLREEAAEAALRARQAELRERAKTQRSLRLPTKAPRPAVAWSAETVVIPAIDTVPIPRPALT
ncbi:hypothetical protein K1W54_22905 [Micromonospora sp. CPCC 205371]|nr:hypothetical protein [Micromonospora sp. CPCC 205371]